MKDIDYNSFIRRLNAFIDNLDELKDEIIAAKFQTEETEEEFLDNCENIVVSIEDIIQSLEADKAYKDLKNSMQE